MTSRHLALLAIQAFQQRGAFVSRVLEDLFVRHNIAPRERRLATELASEVVRRQLLLDTLLDSYVERPRGSIQPEIWMILQLGVCQLICLPRIPAHAAVHETVSLCTALHQQRAKGFVNGILRSLEREILPADDHGSSDPSVEWEPDPHVVPLAELRGGELQQRTVRLARPVFPDFSKDRVDYLARTLSLPWWLIERWLAHGWDTQAIRNLGFWFLTPGHLFLRVNPERVLRERLLDQLADIDVPAVPGPLSEAIHILGSTAISELPGYQDGWFSVQDLSAMSAVDLLAPQAGETILDLCAAPGGKTTHLAERLAGTGRVVACDVDETRLRSVTESAERLQLGNIETHLLPPQGAELPAQTFSAALVDVPCSNTGVLGKRPEARWRIQPDLFERLIPQQQQLLLAACQRVGPGGRVVYSTCSIDPDENERVVQSVLENLSGWRLERAIHHTPGQPADGGYQALLMRD